MLFRYGSKVNCCAILCLGSIFCNCWVLCGLVTKRLETKGDVMLYLFNHISLVYASSDSHDLINPLLTAALSVLTADIFV